MKKGKFGLVLCFYPIAAFGLVILKQPLFCLLLLAVTIFLEKDEWAGRQTIQAFLLSLVVSLFSNVIPWGTSLISISFLSTLLNVASNVFNVIVYVGAVVLSILAILRVMKEQEADIPLLADLAYRAYGQRKPQPVRQLPPTQYQPPQYHQPYQQPNPAEQKPIGPAEGEQGGQDKQ